MGKHNPYPLVDALIKAAQELECSCYWKLEGDWLVPDSIVARQRKRLKELRSRVVEKLRKVDDDTSQ
jgi:hypothetical protein